MGHTKNPDIRIAKSLVDYIFRWMGIMFMPGYREANSGLPPGKSGDEATSAAPSAETPATKPPLGGIPKLPSKTASNDGSNAALLERAGVAIDVDQNGPAVMSRGDQFARFQTDAPSCDNCGAITVRNGNCYLCHNCGNSMGCS